MHGGWDQHGVVGARSPNLRSSPSVMGPNYVLMPARFSMYASCSSAGGAARAGPPGGQGQGAQAPQQITAAPTWARGRDGIRADVSAVAAATCSQAGGDWPPLPRYQP